MAQVRELVSTLRCSDSVSALDMARPILEENDGVEMYDAQIQEMVLKFTYFFTWFNLCKILDHVQHSMQKGECVCVCVCVCMCVCVCVCVWCVCVCVCVFVYICVCAMLNLTVIF